MTDVNRQEIKYILPLEKLAALQNKLDGLMERDGHGNRGEYMVRSQYYDSLKDGDLFDNLNGVMEKRKIRVRIYDAEAEAAKLEYKCKSGNVSRKFSLSINRQEAILMEQGNWEWMLDHPEELAGYLYGKAVREVYIPRTIVEYQRLAYASPVNNTRITFDTQIKGTLDPYGLFGEEQEYVPLMEQDMGVLEIKFDHFFPDYLRKVLNSLDSLAEANSKYTRARLLI